MAKNGLYIRTKSNKWREKQADRVLRFGQMTEKKEKAKPSHLFKILFSRPHICTFGFAPNHKTDPSAKQKESISSHLQNAVKV